MHKTTTGDGDGGGSHNYYYIICRYVWFLMCKTTLATEPRNLCTYEKCIKTEAKWNVSALTPTSVAGGKTWGFYVPQTRFMVLFFDPPVRHTHRLTHNTCECHISHVLGQHNPLPTLYSVRGSDPIRSWTTIANGIRPRLFMATISNYTSSNICAPSDMCPTVHII